MRCGRLIALAGYATFSYASIRPPSAVSFKNCPESAEHVLRVHASDARDMSGVVGTTATIPTLQSTRIIAYVNYRRAPHEIHFCALAIDRYNRTWHSIKDELTTTPPNYHRLHLTAGFPIVIHELTHALGRSRWRHLSDERTRVVAAFRKQKITLPEATAYGPAAAQWLAKHDSVHAMLNADNYAGFALDMALLSEGHMSPAWDWTLSG